MVRYATECDKMVEVKPKSNAIGEFLDWLKEEKGWVLAKAHTHNDGCKCDDGYRICGLHNDELIHCSYVLETLLAEFFGIDMNKVEVEKRAILDEAREG